MKHQSISRLVLQGGTYLYRVAPGAIFFAWVVYACLTQTEDEGFMDDPGDNKPPTFWQMLHSVMAAAFGVQSGKNRARDFTHGKPSHFVILGILFTAVFALTLYGIVQLVLHLAGV